MGLNNYSKKSWLDELAEPNPELRNALNKLASPQKSQPLSEWEIETNAKTGDPSMYLKTEKNGSMQIKHGDLNRVSFSYMKATTETGTKHLRSLPGTKG